MSGATPASADRRAPELERNLRLYAWTYPLARSYFWLPTFWLYLNVRLSLDEILLLHALYYASVVVLEVPSGYASDRLSRVWTLRVAAVAGVASYALFLFAGDRFAVFAAAQLALAAHFSLQSGTDESFHFDTLDGLGRGDEFAEREARLGRNANLAGAGAALVGGAAGAFALWIPYALSLAGAAVLVLLLAAAREPTRAVDGYAGTSFRTQLRACGRQLRRPLLAWLFAYMVLQVVLSHVPYEFAQPYIAAALGERADALRWTPLVTGAMAAVVAALAAAAAAASASLREHFGSARVLLVGTAFQSALIGAMALAIHAVVVPMLAVRGVQAAVGRVVVNAEVVPRVPQAQRATYLSLHSLAGRTGYASLLVFLAAFVGRDAASDPETLLAALRACSLLAVAGLAGLVLAARVTRREDAG